MNLFVFDVDGTLVTRSKKLRKETINTLNRIIDNGDAVCIASGRPFNGIFRYLSKLHDGKKYAICSNGSALLDYYGNVIYDLKISYALFLFLNEKYNYLKNKGLSIYCYIDNSVGYIKYDKWIANEIRSNNIKAINLNKYKPESIQKIMLAAPIDTSKEIILPKEIYEKYNVVRSSSVFLEIINKKCDKSFGVSELKRILNLKDENIFTFGDNQNDYLMIKNFNGISMGNATDEVKKVSKFITKSVYEDGVSYAIKNILNY